MDTFADTSVEWFPDMKQTHKKPAPTEDSRSKTGHHAGYLLSCRVVGAVKEDSSSFPSFCLAVPEKCRLEDTELLSQMERHSCVA